MLSLYRILICLAAIAVGVAIEEIAYRYGGLPSFVYGSGTAPDATPVGATVASSGDTVAAKSKLGPKRQGDADSLIAHAEAGLAAGDPNGALIDFLDALKLRPTDITLLFRTASLRMELRDYTGVIKHTTDAIKIDPKNPGLLFLRSSAQSQLGQWSGALADITAAIENMPKNAALYHTRAHILAQMGRGAEADEDRKKAAEIK
jgi:tetratricopeptide (TPR) repeat protein